MGYGLPQSSALLGIDALDKNPSRMVPEVVPADQNSLAWELARNFVRGTRGFCQFQTGFQRDFGLAAIALADGNGPEKPAGDNDKDNDKTAAEESPSPSTSCPKSSSARRSSTS